MKTRQINVRVSEEDKARLDAAAREHGYRSTADYMRASSLAGRPPREYIFSVILHPGEEDEGGYWAEVPALPGCNSEGDSYQETIENVRQAILGYIAWRQKRGEPIPSEKQLRRKEITAAVKVVA